MSAPSAGARVGLASSTRHAPSAGPQDQRCGLCGVPAFARKPSLTAAVTAITTLSGPAEGSPSMTTERRTRRGRLE